MILKKLSEARSKNQNADLIKEIKEKEPKLAQLRDTTISNIITVYKKEQPEKVTWELTADDIISWFNNSNNFADFVFYYAEELSTYSISDFAEHDTKLANAIRKVLRDDRIINDHDQDLTLSYDAGETPRRKPLTVTEMCVILFNQLSESPVREFDDINTVDPKLLKDKSKFDIKKFMDNVAEVEDAYNKLNEDVEKEVNTEEVPETASQAEEAKPEIVETVFSDMINNAIQEQWNIISTLNSIIATFDFDYKGENREDILTILNQLVDDSTISVGMLHKISELVSTKVTELVTAGENKAENIISE